MTAQQQLHQLVVQEAFNAIARGETISLDVLRAELRDGRAALAGAASLLGG